MRITLMVLMLVAAIFPEAPAKADRPSAQGGDQAILRKIDAQLAAAAAADGFGGTVIIARGGRRVFARGYGYADRAARHPFTPRTVAQIGSITKSMTAYLIAQDVAAGRIALDAPLRRYVPEAPDPAGSVTIGQLLSHRGGLQDTCADDFDRLSEAQLIARCMALPLGFASGEDHYSNMGYSFLALVAQRVGGERWDRLLRDRLWRPLGLRDAIFYATPRQDALFARGYGKEGPQPVISRSIATLAGDDWAIRGNGGIQASADTMIRYLDALLASPRVPAEVRKLMLAPIAGQTGDIREGFGLVHRFSADGRLQRIGHSGSDTFFFSYLCWLPGNDVRFYLVGNNGIDRVQPVLRAALGLASSLPRADKGN